MLTRSNAVKIAAKLNLPEIVRRLARGETLESRLNVHLPTFHGIYECYIDDGEDKCRQELVYQADLFDFNYVEELIKIGARNWDDYEKHKKELGEFRQTIK